VWACEAGKDVYVEKPVGHTLWESQQMVRAAKKYGRIVQGGTQRRSYPIIRSVMGRIRAGEFGRVLRGRVITYGFRESIGKRSSPLPIPSEVDYNQWAGPAPMSPIYRDQLHYDWHWMWETGNGELGNNGAHMLDLARWGLGQDRLAPAVMTIGGRLRWQDAGETPNVLVAYFDYEPAPLIAELRNLPAKPGSRTAGTSRGLKHGFCIERENATVLGLNHYEIRDRRGAVMENKNEQDTKLHPGNFIDAVRNGSSDKLTCPIEVGHASCGLALQGNISYLLGSPNEAELAKTIGASDAEIKDAINRMLGHLDGLGIESAGAKLNVGPMLRFDPASERFTGPLASQANQLLRRPSDRKPFVVPEVS
jgi:predicted dehydrogenase